MSKYSQFMPNQNTNDPTLYQLLGDERLEKLVEEFYSRVQESAIISHLFAGSDFDLVKEKQFRFLSQFLGGPPRYIEKFGHPKMRMRHLPHRIDEAAKTEWLKLMKEAIQTLDWDDQLKDALYNCFPAVANHMQNVYE